MTSHSSMGIQAHAPLWAMFIKLETSLQHLIQPIRLLQILNVEQSSTNLPRIYCNLSTQPCCYEFHCKYDTDSVLYHFLLGCTLTDLTSTDAVGLCADRGFANTLPDGVATRVCQSDGVWNGSIPQCISDGRSTLLNHHNYQLGYKINV